VGGDLVVLRRLVKQPAQVDGALLVPTYLVEARQLLIVQRDLDLVTRELIGGPSGRSATG
jgi:hypothetical protein